MIITDSKKITDVKKEFNAKFPFLKLEFYRYPHKFGEGSSERERWPEEKTIGEVRSVHTEGDLSIDGKNIVADLEENFRSLFGLNVQVFRKSGNSWLQSMQSDSWTLNQQNKHGEESSQFIHD